MLCVLVGAVVGFFLLGAIPGLRVLWDASLLAFGITAGYLALLIHFHRRAAEREMKVVEMQERWSAGVDTTFSTRPSRATTTRVPPAVADAWAVSAARRCSANLSLDRTSRDASTDGPGPAVFPGGVAQLVERHVRNVEVGGSSPLTSTRNTQFRRHFCGESDGARVMSVTLSDLMFGLALPGTAVSATARTEQGVAFQLVVVSRDPNPITA